MGRSATASPALKLYLALNAAALLGAAILMLLLARNGGYSLPLLLLVGAAVILGLAAAALAFLLDRRPAIQNRLESQLSGPRPRLISAAVFIIFWCVVWFPPQYTGDFYYYFIALYPLFLCGLLLSGSALIWLTAVGGSLTARWIECLRQQRLALMVGLLVLAGMALVLLLTAQFRILHGYEPYWYGAGVPLLAAQVLIAVGLAVLALRLAASPGRSPLISDGLIFIVIWLVAAALWASRPVPPSFWVTEPRAPNFELYPFSDPVTYDVASQFALIGQGLFNGAPFDRALYMSFLVYLHIIGGQDYQHLMVIQAAIFAVFPALLYLIGRELHGRLAGLVLAALITMRGLTSLDASAWIDTANFKHMLTDFPTAIGVAAALVLVLRWLSAPHERLSHLVWAGGVLGLTSLLRPHVLLLIAATALLAMWVYRPRFGKAVGAAALVSVAFALGVLPWVALGPSSGSFAAQYGDRLRAVIAQRFPQPARTAEPTPAFALTPAEIEPQPATPSPPVASTPIPAPAVITPPVDPGPPFFVDHFLHNVITSALVLPASPQFLSVRGVVKDGEDFWRPRWTGGMTPISGLTLSLSLTAAALGIGIAVQRDRLRGLIPLGAFLLYLGANSLARTSGGRYIVPVDWIVILYFAIALAEVVAAAVVPVAPASGTSRAGRENRGGAATRSSALPTRRPSGVIQSLSQPVAALVLILLLGGLLPLAGKLFPARYAHSDPGVMLDAIGALAPGAGAAEDINRFLESPDAILTEGRLLYPLHYRKGDGEPTRYAPYTIQDYPRTVIVLIGPNGLLHVVLPGVRTPALTDASDAIVLGCRVRGLTFNLVQAVAVVLPDQELGLVRSPLGPLACPLPAPVCDDDGNCQ